MMKTSNRVMIAALVAIMLQSVAFSAEIEKPGLLKRLFGTLSWNETCQTIESPSDAVSAAFRHIKYRQDIGDTLTPAEETWERGYGDCEDIANAIVELCKAKGLDAWVEVFYSPESFTAHAVAMGNINGQLWIAGRSFRKIDNMNEAKANVASIMRWKTDGIDSRKLSDMDMIHTVASSTK